MISFACALILIIVVMVLVSAVRDTNDGEWAIMVIGYAGIFLLLWGFCR